MGILRQRMRTTNARLSHKKKFFLCAQQPNQIHSTQSMFLYTLLRMTLTEECNM